MAPKSLTFGEGSILLSPTLTDTSLILALHCGVRNIINSVIVVQSNVRRKPRSFTYSIMVFKIEVSIFEPDSIKGECSVFKKKYYG